jgi:hypothetical protein
MSKKDTFETVEVYFLSDMIIIENTDNNTDIFYIVNLDKDSFI